MYREKELESLEIFLEYAKNRNFSIKSGFMGLVEYTEMDIMNRTFDRDWNRFKEKKFNIEKAYLLLDEWSKKEETEIEKLKIRAFKFNLPCLKKEQEKILNKIAPYEKRLNKYENMKSFFEKFDSYSNIEQLYYFFKFNILID